MEPDAIMTFVAIIVGACILGGAIYSGLIKVADAIGKIDNIRS